MNIFILDEDIEKCVQVYTDRHCVKMILESAQLLCTAIRIHGGTKTVLTNPLGKNKIIYLLPGETYKWIKQGKKVKRIDDCGNAVIDVITTYNLWLSSGLYIQSHVNHPCAVWVRESTVNFAYVYNLTHALNKEYMIRFNKNNNHKSYGILIKNNVAKKIFEYSPKELIGIYLTPFVLCMPDEYKVQGDAVQSYRNYYNGEKQHLFKWTNRDKPFWATK